MKAFQTSALAALFAAAAITGVRAADPIKIGVVTPLSGTYAGIGQQVRCGLDLAVKEVNAAMDRVKMDTAFASRNVNEGFSGGEKKRHEIVQLELLDPKVAVLDETDSGLDIDALKIVSDGVNRFKEDGDKGVLLITHYTRILRYITPDFVHVFVDGRVAEEGGPELAEQLEAEGYDKYTKSAV